MLRTEKRKRKRDKMGRKLKTRVKVKTGRALETTIDPKPSSGNKGIYEK